MKRQVLASLMALAVCVPSFASAEDASFISLTRSPLKKNELPANVSVITREAISRSGYTSLDQVLQEVASVDVQKGGADGAFSTARIRGVTSSSQVQIVIDDQPLGGISTQFIDLAQVPLDNVERIEIVRGGSSVLYGANTTGGVVHVITRKGTTSPRAALRVERGSLDTNTVRTEVQGGAGGFDVLATAGIRSSDGYQSNEKSRNRSFTASTGYSFPNAARVAVDVERVFHEVGNPRGTSFPIGEWDGRKERVALDKTSLATQDRVNGRLKASLPVGAGAVEAVLHGSDQDYATLSKVGTKPTFEQNNRIIGADARFRSEGGTVIGASYEHDRQETVGSLPNKIDNGGAYAQTRIMAGRLAVMPGVRYDNHQAFGEKWSPRLSLVLPAADSLTLSVNAAKSFRAPSFLELYYKSSGFNGNKNLKPETAWTYDLGAEWRFAEEAAFRVNGYFSRIKQRIVANSTTYENKPDAELSGAELGVSAKVGRVRSSVDYAYTRAKGNSATTADFVALRLTPRHTVVGKVDVELPLKLVFANTVRYVSRQFKSDAGKGLQLPPYAVWNTRLDHVQKWGKVYVGADNVLNRRYAETFDTHPVNFSTTFNPQPDRTYRVGADLTFGGADR